MPRCSEGRVEEMIEGTLPAISTFGTFRQKVRARSRTYIVGRFKQLRFIRFVMPGLDVSSKKENVF